MNKFIHSQLGLCNEHEACNFVLEKYGQSLDDPKYIGCGGEGFVFSCNGYIHKFIVNWNFPKRDIEKSFNELSILSKKIFSPKYLYEFSVYKIDNDCLQITYLADPGQPINYLTIQEDWQIWLHNEMIHAFDEMYNTGFFTTDPSPSNFIISNNQLRFVDYGCDCKLIKEAIIKLSEMLFMIKLKKKGIHLWRP